MGLMRLPLRVSLLESCEVGFLRLALEGMGLTGAKI